MAIVGNVIDRRFDTDPVFTLVFLALGLFAGFFGAYRQLRKLMRRSVDAGGQEGR